MSDTKDPRNYNELLSSLIEDVDEEIDSLRVLVNDDDSSRPMRNLRAERLAAFEYMRRLFVAYRNWEWS